MNIALITARGERVGFKDNPLLPILGRPLITYPYLAAVNASTIERIFLSTDGIETKKLGMRLGLKTIERPAHLSLPGVGHLEVLQHALEHVKSIYDDIEVLVVLLGNVATHEQGIIDKCVEVLTKNQEVDSCVTVSQRNEFHPLRAKVGDGELTIKSTDSNFDFVDLRSYMDVKGKVSTNRQDLDSVFFLNHAVWALRPKNCVAQKHGQWPGPFLGNTVVGIETDHGIDIRDIEDVAFSERWLLNHGWTMNDSPYWNRRESNI